MKGRVHAEVKMNFLASPPLVVAYAIAGTMDIDLRTEPLGLDPDGKEIYLKDIWPSQAEINQTMAASIDSNLFRQSYREVFGGDSRWAGIEAPKNKSV